MTKPCFVPNNYRGDLTMHANGRAGATTPTFTNPSAHAGMRAMWS